MLDERPTAAELVAAVADFLEQEVRPALDGRLAFHATVAVNALRIVIRELSAEPEPDRGANTELARRIRDGELSTSDHALRDQLIRDVLSRLAIDNPRYPSLAEAAGRWPDAMPKA